MNIRFATLVIGACMLTHQGLTIENNATPPPEATVTVLVGIVANATLEPRTTNAIDYFAILEKQSSTNKTHFHFRLAYGGYNDVYYWAVTGQIDLGLFSPVLYSEIQGSVHNWETIVGIERSHIPMHQSEYRSMCIVPRQSHITHWSTIIDLINSNAASLICTDPLSLSGYVAPMHRIKQEPALKTYANVSNLVEFRFTHDSAAQFIEKRFAASNAQPSSTNRLPVAFMRNTNETIEANIISNGTVIMDCPLNNLWLTHSAVAIRHAFEHRRELEELFALEEENPNYWCGHPKADCTKNFENIYSWLTDIGIDTANPQLERLSLEDIGRLLDAYSKQSKPPLRIALVLSGGGAKCAYQVGALFAIENMLAKLRADHPDVSNSFDIALVVGTSGGALNAIPVAMKKTTPTIANPSVHHAYEGGLAYVWLHLHKWSILSLESTTFWCLILACGPITVLFIIGTHCLLKHCMLYKLLPFSEVSTRKWKLFIVMTFVIATLGMGIAIAKSFQTLDWIYLNATFWKCATISMSIYCFIYFGMFIRWMETRKGGAPLITNTMVFWSLAFSSGMIVVLALWVALFAKSMISPDGLEQELLSGYSTLLQENEATNRTKINIGREVIANIRRDLVITESNLREDNQVPSDFYLFVHHDPLEKPYPPVNLNWASMDNDGNQLVDCVIGSGTLFPFFQSKSLIFPSGMFARELNTGHNVNAELVDGGFAHNSPIAAAVEWGATHIFLIEASPAPTNQTGRLLENVGLAFEHLYGQAQLSDLRAQHETIATVFALRPARLYTDRLGFEHPKVMAAIIQGEEDASGKRIQSNNQSTSELRPNAFVRQPASPSFHD